MEPFKVHVLGCGSALPTMRHFPSSQVIELREKLFMVDCGEGTQLQMRRCKVKFGKLGHVFISHLHGDHCFGLIGMISTLGLLGRTADLHVHADKALEPVLQMLLRSFCTDLGFKLVFHAIDTSAIHVIYEDRSLTVETIPLAHRIPTCGFLFREKPTLPHIRRDMIDMYEIPVSQIMNIKNGMDWTTPDGEVVPNSRLVTLPEPPRSYAYCSDTRYQPEMCVQLQGIDTLYHESTYGEDNLLMAQKYNHATARQAALIARQAGVRKLILGHFSSRYDDENVLLNEAREVFENVFLANELDVFDV